MNIVSKNELIFKVIYFCLILLTGIFLSVYSGNRAVIIFSLIIPFIYLLSSMRKEIGRLRVLRRPFSSEWRSIIEKYSKFYSCLNDEGKTHFEGDVAIFLKENSVRGIRGERVNIATELLVAIGVATILHGRPDWELPFSDGVVVYPGETFDHEYNLHKGEIAGMASKSKPLLVTEGILKKSFGDSMDGYNSLLHEIAHYFDFENPVVNGVPLIGTDVGETEEWMDIMERERKKVNRGKSFLRQYAGLNEAEFFAVATEYFFEQPDIMIKNNRELYEILSSFYNLDTNSILGIHFE